MIFDHRTYTCKPGMLKPHLALYEKMGYAPQSRLLGKPVLHAFTEIGDPNSYIHVWGYKDLAERTAKRARMWSDPEWLAYVAKSAELGALYKQHNTILVASSFWTPPAV